MKKKNIVETSLGFKASEDTARYLDSLLKTLPKDKAYSYRKKSVAAEMQFEPGEKASIDVITTDSVDAEREVVLPEGVGLDAYRKNPIVLFAHDDQKPVGKSLWIKSTSNGLKSKTVYAQRPTDFEGEFFPEVVFALVQQDILKGRSVGFVPVQLDVPTQEQVKARPDWKSASVIISKSVLFEYSVVSVPCNQEALHELVSKKLKGLTAKSLMSLGLPIPKPRIDEAALLTACLDRLKFNNEAIASKVIDCLKKRGKV